MMYSFAAVGTLNRTQIRHVDILPAGGKILRPSAATLMVPAVAYLPILGSGFSELEDLSARFFYGANGAFVPAVKSFVSLTMVICTYIKTYMVGMSDGA